MGVRRLLALTALVVFALTFGPTITTPPLPSIASSLYVGQPRAYLPFVSNDPTPTPYACDKVEQLLVNGDFESGQLKPWDTCYYLGCTAPTVTSERAAAGTTYSALFDSSSDWMEQGGVTVPSWTEAIQLKFDFYLTSSISENQSSGLNVEIVDEDSDEMIASATIPNQTQYRNTWLVAKLNVNDDEEYRGHRLLARIRAASYSGYVTQWFVDQAQMNFACGTKTVFTTDQAGTLEIERKDGGVRRGAHSEQWLARLWRARQRAP